VSPPTDDAGTLGPWDPLTPAATRALFTPAPFVWWLAGGHALDLFVGRPTRPHHDVDVAMLRVDAPLLRPVVEGWDLRLAHDGTLTSWTTDDVAPPCNSVWCRTAPSAPWGLQVMFEDGNPTEWICRRHPDIALPMAEVICHAPDGTPYVAPQIQLLMKAKGTRPKDDADYATVAPLLSPAAARWLDEQLRQFYPGHPWSPYISLCRSTYL